MTIDKYDHDYKYTHQVSSSCVHLELLAGLLITLLFVLGKKYVWFKYLRTLLSTLTAGIIIPSSAYKAVYLTI